MDTTPSGVGTQPHMACSALMHTAIPLNLAESATWPQMARRYGAAEAMAHCAGVLTKDEGLADEFYLEALACCVTALHLAEHDAEGTGTRTAALNAIRVSWLQLQATASAWLLGSALHYAQLAVTWHVVMSA